MRSLFPCYDSSRDKEKEVCGLNIAGFTVDSQKCVGCGACIKVCPGGILYLDEEKKAQIQPVSEFGWNGCWRCEHCLAVCPAGAVSVLGHKPKESLPMPEKEESRAVLDALVANRHSCRRYQDKNVDREVIADMMNRLANAPNGGNKQLVEYTLIDDKDKMQAFRMQAYERMEQLAKEGIFPEGFDKTSYEQMKGWERTVRPDMLFCGAPHLLIPHVPLGSGEPRQDAAVAGAYFELLCMARGLGAVMMTFPLYVLDLMPDIRARLQIPREHYIPMIIGFGFPEIPYRRGVQKTLEGFRIHRPFAKEE